jgi:prevent-host-death family protein
MTTTTLLKFRREFDAFQQYARFGPVEIARYGRRALVLMSAEHYDWVRATGRRAHRTSGYDYRRHHNGAAGRNGPGTRFTRRTT